jgi:hypothetical protein
VIYYQYIKSKQKNGTGMPAKKTSTKKKKTTSKKTPKNKPQGIRGVDQNFMAFLTLLVISGFLIGGLVGSFNFYRAFVSQQESNSVTLPATGSVVETNVETPTPDTVIPGEGNELGSISNTDGESMSVGENEPDPRQPEGTIEFNEGDYKVYQYPDGNIIVVW